MRVLPKLFFLSVLVSLIYIVTITAVRGAEPTTQPQNNVYEPPKWSVILFSESDHISVGSGPAFIVRISNLNDVNGEIDNLCSVRLLSHGKHPDILLDSKQVFENLHIRIDISGVRQLPFQGNGLCAYTGRIFKKPLLQGQTQYIDSFFDGLPLFQHGSYKVQAILLRDGVELERSAEKEIVIDE